MKQSAVFLDRDGTINRDVPYCSRPEQFELLPGVGIALRKLNEVGLRVVVVTNQSGIARGYFSQQDLELIHQKMMCDLARYGAHVDGVYYCPHHPLDGCDCRKPKPGLILKAVQELGIDVKRSFVVGDGPGDVGAAKAAGCNSVLISSDGCVDNGQEYSCCSLFEAVEWILENC